MGIEAADIVYCGTLDEVCQVCTQAAFAVRTVLTSADNRTPAGQEPEPTFSMVPALHTTGLSSHRSVDTPFSSPIGATWTSGTIAGFSVGRANRIVPIYSNLPLITSNPTQQNSPTPLKSDSRYVILPASHTLTSKLSLMWAVNLEKCIDASPLLVTRTTSVSSSSQSLTTVYVGSHSGIIVAVDLRTGHEYWRQQLPDRIEGGAATSQDGKVVTLGCYDGNLYALCADTGRLRWSFKTGDIIKCTPTIDKSGCVWFGSYDRFLYVLHPISLATAQTEISSSAVSHSKLQLEAPVFASPAYCSESNIMLVATLKGQLIALSSTKQSMQVLWRRQFEAPIFASPMCFAPRASSFQTLTTVSDDSGDSSSNCSLAETFAVVACVDGRIICLDIAGKEQWRLRVPSQKPIFSSPTLLAIPTESTYPGIMPVATRTSVLVFGCHDGVVYGINPFDGGISWKVDTLPSRVPRHQLEFQNTTEAVAIMASVAVEVHTRHYISVPVAREHLQESGKFSPAERSKRRCLKNQTDASTRRLCFLRQDGGIHLLTLSAKTDSCLSPELSSSLSCIQSESGASGKTVRIFHSTRSATLEGDLFASPAFLEGHLVVGCRDDNLYCFRV